MFPSFNLSVFAKEDVATTNNKDKKTPKNSTKPPKEYKKDSFFPYHCIPALALLSVRKIRKKMAINIAYLVYLSRKESREK